MYSTTAQRRGFIIIFRVYKVERRMRDLPTTTDTTRRAVHNIIIYTLAKRKRIYDLAKTKLMCGVNNGQSVVCDGGVGGG